MPTLPAAAFDIDFPDNNNNLPPPPTRLANLFRSKEAMMIGFLSFGQFMDTISDIMFLNKYQRYGGNYFDGRCAGALDGDWSSPDGDDPTLKNAQQMCSFLLIIVCVKESMKGICTATLFNHPFFHSPTNFQNLHTSPFLWLLMLFSSTVQDLALKSADEATEKPAVLHLAVDLLTEDIPQLIVSGMFFAATSDVACWKIYSLPGYGDNPWMGRSGYHYCELQPDCQTPVCKDDGLGPDYDPHGMDQGGGVEIDKTCSVDDFSSVDGVMIFSLLMTFFSVAGKVYKALKVVQLQRKQLLTAVNTQETNDGVELASVAVAGVEGMGQIEDEIALIKGAAARQSTLTAQVARDAKHDRRRIEILEQQLEQMAIAVASMNSVRGQQEESVKLLGA